MPAIASGLAVATLASSLKARAIRLAKESPELVPQGEYGSAAHAAFIIKLLGPALSILRKKMPEAEVDEALLRAFSNASAFVKTLEAEKLRPASGKKRGKIEEDASIAALLDK